MVQADQSSARGDRRLWVLRLRRRFRVKRAIKKTARATSAYTPQPAGLLVSIGAGIAWTQYSAGFQASDDEA